MAVYAIALNEEQFVSRWAESAKDADYLFIADTGSTDGTIELAKLHNIHIARCRISPWRFDDARNFALANLPDDIDYCVALDMDEVLIEGWRAELEEALKAGSTRPRYKYTWSWNDSGSPGLQYGGDKIHARHGYRWKHPVHEVLVADRIEEVQVWVDLEIHHHPDESKSRGQYFPLLELAVAEDPLDDRNTYYLAREYYYHARYEEAAKTFRKHLDLPKAVWKPERAASMRYLATCEPENREKWLLASHLEDPARREPLVELARYYYESESWEACLDYAKLALEITEKPLDYLCEDFAWGYLPYDFAAISSFHLGNKADAWMYGQMAVELNPTESRLIDNLTYYSE